MARKLIFALVLLYGVMSGAAVPSTTADLGACSAHFRVTDASGNAVQGATIHVSIDRKLLTFPGFFTFRGIPWRSKDVQVTTDRNGEAEIVGLPEKVKSQLVFDVAKARFMNLIVYAPESDSCHPSFNVRFE